MPTVFVYEFCCAVGVGGSLGREGQAMRDAVADDFRRLPGVIVVTLDAANHAESEQFRELAGSADATLVIAPEFDDLLADRCRWVREAGRELLGPTASAVRLTADKLVLYAQWRTGFVRTPTTLPAGDPAVGRPAVWKPRYGAGSTDTVLVRTAEDEGRVPRGGPELIAQSFVPGRAASVAFLVGPSQTVPLLPTFQHLSDDGRFTYLGGELPIPPDLAERAVAFGRKAISCVPGLRGYVGVDLVLGDAADGSQDYAIEINPRLTTSYVGLRALAETNLAGAMLDVCAGRPVEVRWKPGQVRFTPDGVS